jgi:hypothetical protein
LNLVPENIGLIIVFGPHEPEFAVGNRTVTVVNETLLCHDEIMAAHRRYQDNNAKPDQSFRNFFNPN